MVERNLTPEILRSFLSYDPATGQFRWLFSRGTRSKGSVAGYRDRTGRLYIKIARARYLAHRLAWLYTNGRWPDGEIDHRNGVPFDNRISNLRNVDDFGNLQNQRIHHKNNTTGFLGIKRSRNGRYCAAIQVNKEQKWLGTFDTPEDAHAAYVAAKRRLHSTCTI